MTPPTTEIPTNVELTDFLGAIKTDTRQHPYEKFPQPRRTWRDYWARPRTQLDPMIEDDYRREQADYDGGYDCDGGEE